MALTPSGIFLKIYFPGTEVGLELCFSHGNQALLFFEGASTDLGMFRLSSVTEQPCDIA